MSKFKTYILFFIYRAKDKIENQLSVFQMVDKLEQQFLLELTKVNISKCNIFLKNILQGNPLQKYIKTQVRLMIVILM